MTPAVQALKRAKIGFQLHTYDHDPTDKAYGREAARKLGIPFDRLFKTLIAAVDDRDFAVALVPVSAQLDLKSLANALGVRKAVMAEKQSIQRITGYIPGGVSPVGQKKTLPTIVDRSADDFETIFVSAGRRGLQIEVAPADLIRLTHAALAPISR